MELERDSQTGPLKVSQQKKKPETPARVEVPWGRGASSKKGLGGVGGLKTTTHRQSGQFCNTKDIPSDKSKRGVQIDQEKQTTEGTKTGQISVLKR